MNQVHFAPSSLLTAQLHPFGTRSLKSAPHQIESRSRTRLIFQEVGLDENRNDY